MIIICNGCKTKWTAQMQNDDWLRFDLILDFKKLHLRLSNNLEWSCVVKHGEYECITSFCLWNSDMLEKSLEINKLQECVILKENVICNSRQISNGENHYWDKYTDS